ncbi:WD repeat-containing protein 7 [Cocos nucifera]|uniref:WD repeat-containing protein 7 n=1 Tax=Cocos nucifera TaxID=13894 RepID=A0A8K0MYR3_COCNU|nr:WD repeat-containing protein 7 [Cocos nucifera]
MKCPSVACLWPASPPPHRITAAAAVPDPPALYTGGFDGSIVWWNLAAAHDIWPMAMLCGHAAPIADLVTCMPADSEQPSPKPAPALFSACVDGVLCVWSVGRGRCRRRRRLPPWAGTPSLLSPLPSSPRYVCIVCSSSDSAAVHHPNFTAGDGEAQPRRAPKCAVVIVDSCTMNVLQTVFHGSLSIGPVKSMAVVSVDEDGPKNKHDVILVDGNGRTQLLAVAEADHDGQGANFPRGSSSPDIAASVSGEISSEEVQAVAFSDDRKLLALVYGNHCVFKCLADGVTVGEISLLGSSLYNEDPSTKAQLIGGMFLEDNNGVCESEIKNFAEVSGRMFAVWNTNGAAMAYRISGSGAMFEFEALCKIPDMPCILDRKASVRFCRLNHCLVRVESISFVVSESLIWRPYITRWLIEKIESRLDNNLGKPYPSKLVGEGGFPGDLTNEAKDRAKKSSQQSCTEGSNNSNGLCSEPESNGLGLSKRIVSSSMVLSEYFCSPYAVVYGFYSGEIEVLRFTNLSPDVNSDATNVKSQIYPYISERFFSGHTGAVLCLAAHRMVACSEGQCFHQALISGSMDSTVRIWDMDTGSLLSVMHHHIAPVRQIILPPPWTNRPWNNCFLSVGEDHCVALVSLDTLCVERMFPGHHSYPSMVAWDTTKGYIACQCRNLQSSSDAVSVLYLWDVKSGARERIIRGTASHSMFDHFCRGINKNSLTGSILGGTTSASSLLLPVFKDGSQSHVTKSERGLSAVLADDKSQRSTGSLELNNSLAQSSRVKVPLLGAVHGTTCELAGSSFAKPASSQCAPQKIKHPVKCYCPFPGVASLKFDLSSLMSLHLVHNSDKQVNTLISDLEIKELASQHGSLSDNSDVQASESHPIKESIEGSLLRFSLCFLHLWDVDHEVDKLLVNEMNVCKPEGCYIASGVLGDRGSLTLMFPGLRATLEFWKASSEFCAMRSLALVSLAQRMISLSHSGTTASSALAAFYTRNFAEKVPDIKPPLLQVAQYANAPRAIPHPLHSQKIISREAPSSPLDVTEENVLSNTGDISCNYTVSHRSSNNLGSADIETSSIVSWMESFETQGWTSWVGGTSQDAMASNIIVAAALVVWYPSIVKDVLAKQVVNQLIKLVMSMNDQYSSTAAELLAEGMDSTWKVCLGPEISHLVGDIFFQIECLSGTPNSSVIQNPAVAVTIREALVGTLLPSLAMADVIGFLNVIEGQIWATSSDSSVHLVSLKTLIRIVRGSPKPLAPYLDKILQVVSYVLQTMDPSNLVMRKVCLHTSMLALREIARVFPMIALNGRATRLAVGDAIGDIHSVTIRVYDVESVTKIKILDASGPPGLPILLEGASNSRISTAITALSFSPDGEVQYPRHFAFKGPMFANMYPIP